MVQHHHIVQTKGEYYDEQYQRLRFFWWIFASAVFAYISYLIIKDFQKAIYVLIGFVLIFATADLTKSYKLKRALRIIIGLFYLAGGILFIYFYNLMRGEEGSIFNLILAGIFLILAYKDLKRHLRFLRFRRKDRGYSNHYRHKR